MTIEWHESPVPCKMCGSRYALPHPYDEVSPLIRDYCFDCYCLKMDKLHLEAEEAAMAEECKRREFGLE